MENTIIIIFFILPLIFIVINIIFLITIRIKPNQKYLRDSYLSFSIVIAAKNEETNLPGLINSLNNLIYPKEKFEIILVDDNSNDNTFTLANELKKDIDNFNAYKISDKKLPGKKGALTFGIGRANNPYIMITDADCRPGPNWLNIYSGYFEKGVDFLFGISPFIQNNTLINKISCFENLRNSILTFTAAKLGIPYSASARNFGFKKTSFEKLNGYANTAETLSGDDDLLLREAVKNRFKIGIIINKDALVLSSAKNNFREYLIQKSRHTKTSIHYLLKHKILLGSWHILNLFFLFSIVLYFVNSFFLWLFVLKILTDITLVLFTQKTFNYKFNIFEIFYLQVFYEIFLIINFYGALFRKDKWS